MMNIHQIYSADVLLKEKHRLEGQLDILAQVNRDYPENVYYKAMEAELRRDLGIVLKSLEDLLTEGGI